jgi:hypothetical protein
VAQAIVLAILDGGTFSPAGKIVAIGQGAREVPPFGQPILKEDFGRADAPEVAIDARNFTAVDKRSNLNVVRNAAEMELAITKAALSQMWVDDIDREGHSTFHRMTTAPMFCYAAWISRALGQRRGLDREQVARLSILAAYYFGCLCYTEEAFEQGGREAIMVSIARNLKMEKWVNLIKTVTDDLGYMHSISDFTAVMGAAVGTVRLDEFGKTPTLLYNFTAGVWFGNNAAETLRVAIEHPPTFVSLVYASVASKSYSTSTLAKIAIDHLRGDEKTFIRAVTTAVRLYATPNS